ncbi:MAG: beta-N-acetylhexosaminidase [bacterium]
MLACRVALLALVHGAILSGQAVPGSNLLPRPSEIHLDTTSHEFILTNPVRIVIPAHSPRLAEIAELLASTIRRRTGYAVHVGTTASSRRAIQLDTSYRSAIGEAYTLVANEHGVTIHGATSAGALWGVQTFRQLLPAAFDDARGKRPARWPVPAVTIHDAPRFGWRGSMVDVSRHFFTVAVIKRHIDLLSRYKMNVFHWHLTDDQGWRVEIKRYPELTRIGAWRTESDGTRYGGFYTQREIRDVVEYARQRGIMVVPEIEMPGHARAALAAYPNLGCTNDTVAVATDWGVHADIYCVGEERTLAFVQNVLDEVIPLFSSPYIHIGGDEVPKARWRECKSCQDLMRRESLANEDELQRWFVGRIGQYLATRGKRLIGWNEILQGDHLMSGAIVQSWQDSSWTRRAALEGHDVIASPEQWTYLNRSASELTTDRVYSFDPIPPGLDSTTTRRVLGAEVALWSEHVVSGANLDLMTLPRTLAFAEVMWSDTVRDAGSLRRRLDADHLPRLRAMGIAVGPPDRELMDVSLTYDPDQRTARVRTAGAAAGVVLRGRSDGHAPTATSPVIADSSQLSDGLTRLQPFYGTEPILHERTVLVERHRALGAKTVALTPPNPQYRGTGTWSLTDGLRGSTDHGDGLWQGWWGPDVDVVVTVDSVQSMTSLAVSFLQDTRSWILMPRQVEFSWSSDSVQWSPAVVRTHDIPATADGARIQQFMVVLPAGTRARFVHVIARNPGLLPTGHPGAGSPSWLFVDEIVVH